MSILSRRSRHPLGRPFGYLWSASALTNLGDGILLAAGPLPIASLIWRLRSRAEDGRPDPCIKGTKVVAAGTPLS